MTKMDKRAEDREALERLLEIYGADRTRWPARERLRFAGVISDDKAAARMLAEADALDRLLEQAPRASVGRRRRAEGADRGGGACDPARRSSPSLPAARRHRGKRTPSDARSGVRGEVRARPMAGGGDAGRLAGARRHARLDRHARCDHAARWREVDRLRQRANDIRLTSQLALGEEIVRASPTRTCYDRRGSPSPARRRARCARSDGVAGAQRADHRRRGGHVVLLASGHGPARQRASSRPARLCAHAAARALRSDPPKVRRRAAEHGGAAQRLFAMRVPACATALMAEPFDQAKFNAALDGVVQAETNEQRAKVTLFGETRRAADAGRAPAAARLAREAPPAPLIVQLRAPSPGHARRGSARRDALGEEVGLHGAVEHGDGAPSARRRFDLQQRRSLHLQQRAGEADGQRSGSRHGAQALACRPTTTISISSPSATARSATRPPGAARETASDSMLTRICRSARGSPMTSTSSGSVRSSCTSRPAALRSTKAQASATACSSMQATGASHVAELVRSAVRASVSSADFRRSPALSRM